MKSSPSIFFLSLLPLSAWSFLTPSTSQHRQLASSSLHSPSNLVSLSAKKTKKKRTSSSGEGFGKSSAPPASSAVREDEATTASDNASTSRALQSIATDDSQRPSSSSPAADLNLDPNLPPEEKSQAILRQKFGLKSFEEQQADIGDYRALLDSEKKKEKRDKLRNLDKIWPEDRDFVAVLPPAVIKGVDTFLKLGLGLCTGAFLVAGVFITIEAGSKATGYALPAGLEDFVVNIVQPYFTPGLGVLLLFSVSLGLFSVGLGGSASSTYKESP
eukprot:CAMPEP_0172296958 /NCGR_PEP_ID=MMETSP1058-20130122/141_1 /TAXON_ID=83371 /ORGANISM="Detonula confervacea, Strain CCMP 353" /LENGTH=272 /DNA_ID=CAMNT_0013006043 /DNA_START=56 /DNA_END=874 /DNA_ORIENTATION=-